MAGVEIPVHGEPRHMWFSPESGGVRDDVPLTIDFSTSFYFHREGPGIVFGGREAALEDVAEHALRRLPLVVDLPIQSSWWGYYEVSPDHNAIVGESSEPGRFLYATGFSGPRLPAGPGGRRAPRAADPRRAAGLRPGRLLARALRARRAARRALRRVTGAPPCRKTSDRATAVSSTLPTYRFLERILYLGGASTYFGSARCETEAYANAGGTGQAPLVKKNRYERKTSPSPSRQRAREVPEPATPPAPVNRRSRPSGNRRRAAPPAGCFGPGTASATSRAVCVHGIPAWSATWHPQRVPLAARRAAPGAVSRLAGWAPATVRLR